MTEILSTPPFSNFVLTQLKSKVKDVCPTKTSGPEITPPLEKKGTPVVRLVVRSTWRSVMAWPVLFVILNVRG